MLVRSQSSCFQEVGSLHEHLKYGSCQEMYPEPTAIVEELRKNFIVCKKYLCSYVANAFISHLAPIAINHLLSQCLTLQIKTLTKRWEGTRCIAPADSVSLDRAVHTGRTKLSPAAAAMRLESTNSPGAGEPAMHWQSSVQTSLHLH